MYTIRLTGTNGNGFLNGIEDFQAAKNIARDLIGKAEPIEGIDYGEIKDAVVLE